MSFSIFSFIDLLALGIRVVTWLKPASKSVNAAAESVNALIRAAPAAAATVATPPSIAGPASPFSFPPSPPDDFSAPRTPFSNFSVRSSRSA